MKKSYFILMASLVHFCVSAQQFTNASVYNFSVGDTIVSEYYDYYASGGLNTPPVTKYKVYLQKTISIGQDTIWYQGTISSVSLSLSPNFGQTASTSTFVEVITNLTAPAYTFVATPDTCSSYDSTYSKICNLSKLYIFLQPLSNCFEPPIKNETFIEGAGYYFVYRSTVSNPIGLGTESKFIKASKVGSGCAVVGTFPTGIATIKKTEQQAFFPCPITNQSLELNLSENAIVRICDLNGRTVLLETVEMGGLPLNIENISNGLYFVNLITPTRNRTEKLLIQKN